MPGQAQWPRDDRVLAVRVDQHRGMEPLAILKLPPEGPPAKPNRPGHRAGHGHRALPGALQAATRTGLDIWATDPSAARCTGSPYAAGQQALLTYRPGTEPPGHRLRRTR
jgi:hypothetical protein